MFVGALYNTPKPQYQHAVLLDYIEAGDFNMLDDTEVATRGAMLSIVDRPTRGANNIVDNPWYATVRVVESTVSRSVYSFLCARVFVSFSA